MLSLDLIHTLAFGGVALLVGYGLRRVFPALQEYNLPAPVLGGLLVAIVVTIARGQDISLFTFDTTLQSPLMIAFFTSIGFGASLSLLRVGGPQVMRFFAIATVFAIVQNVAGVLMALPFGLHPLFGVLAGSVTLTGGPATGLAFAPLFEQAGVEGASAIAIAAAMSGIVAGGLVGGPLGTWLVRRYGLHSDAASAVRNPVPKLTEAEAAAPPPDEDEERQIFPIIKNLVAILLAMWIGSWVGRGFTALGITLPATIGAMLVAAVIRNLDDA
ncbi:MAG: sodium/glutamate symporter, partial [Steroidobacteraceae bacterium]